MNSSAENNHMREPGEGGLIQEFPKPQLSHTNINEINNLDKVRDILFGSQTREVEKRFTRLEERLSKEFSNIRDETKKRLDSLEIYIKKEIESLAERLKNEQIERNNLVKELAEESKNVATSLEKKLAQFDEQSTHSQRELREQILNQSQSLHDDIRQKYEEIITLLERETQELQRDKTDRSHLASLFTELAIRLNADK
jgi:DNA repair exonuclease SbcCD ATPase subunit